jgi:hypothetical protein
LRVKAKLGYMEALKALEILRGDLHNYTASWRVRLCGLLELWGLGERGF